MNPIGEVNVLRGIPGSGKSYLAEQRWPSATTCSADHYFVGPDGRYAFDPRGLQAAHNQCLRNFNAAVQRGDPVIVVDNTNVHDWEIAPYAALALAYGYKLTVVTVVCSVEIAHERNRHGVPIATVRKMAHELTWKTLPRHWNQTAIGIEGT